MATHRALIFPGQGSQTIGMGRELAEAYPAAREVFDAVDDALETKLSELMWHGEQATLTLTANAQPALMAHSIAALRAITAETGQGVAELADCVAGHSLGEYSALVAAGTLELGDAAKLLRLRGEAMQTAVPEGQGAMVAVLGVTPEQGEALAAAAASATGQVCDPANDNAPGQMVLSGSAAAIQKAIEIAKDHGAKRAIPLVVSAPFHCALMAPAQEAMADALAATSFSAPAVPVVCNVTATATSDPDALRSNLITQVTGRVRWRESVAVMRTAPHAIEQFAEVGAGKVLSGLVRQVDRAATVMSIGTPDQVAQFAAERVG
ncbi:MAG: ACP S-malonyltransferase [Pseudomonadota bacterium]